METALLSTGIDQRKIFSFAVAETKQKPVSNNAVGKLARFFTWWTIKMRIFYFACITIRNPKKLWKAYKDLLILRSNIWGGDLKKIYKIDGKYYYNMYTPAWPSPLYDSLIKSELRRKADPLNETEKLSFVFLAITRKCPMRCEHCFEWDNLNQKESFSKDDLYKTLDLFIKEGVLQFHFSGGEPMVRFKDLVDLIRFVGNRAQCWVLTSGFNVTEENARKLKEAGCKGMVVSIDHYIPELHNMFRGNVSAFEGAVNAVRYAKQAGLVTAVSVCATKKFIDDGHVMPYLEFAKNLGVQFVQLLEPKNVGQYKEKEVLLEETHIQELEEIFKTVNFSPAYSNYPTLTYHGYHQRRVGCFSGSRSVYVDSAGDVHACPFCHTKSYNIISWVRGEYKSLPQKENTCSRYDKIA